MNARTFAADSALFFLALAALVLGPCSTARAGEWIDDPTPAFGFCADPGAARHDAFVVTASGYSRIPVPGGASYNRVELEPRMCDEFRVVVNSYDAEGFGWQSNYSKPYQVSPDLNGDGIVGAMDFSRYRGRFTIHGFAALPCFKSWYLKPAPDPVDPDPPLGCAP